VIYSTDFERKYYNELIYTVFRLPKKNLKNTSFFSTLLWNSSLTSSKQRDRADVPSPKRL